MKINAVELRVLKMRLLKPFRTSFGVQQDRYPLLVRLEISGASRAQGYRRIKVKIEPGWDVMALGAVRERYPEITLMADANAAYGLDDADHLAQLDRFGLLMLEQPLAAGDLVDHAALQRQVRTPICLDESIESARDARQALQLGACQVINIKPGRVGGFAESRRIHDIAANAGVPVWCGGMLETGIGRACSVALNTAPISKSVKMKSIGRPTSKLMKTIAGATKSATWVEEPTAISSVTSTLLRIAKNTADACSAALLMIGIRMRPTKIGEILSVCRAGLRAETSSSDSRPTSNAAPNRTPAASALDHSGFSFDAGVRNRCALVNCMKTSAQA